MIGLVWLFMFVLLFSLFIGLVPLFRMFGVCPHLVDPSAGCSKFLLQLRQPLRSELLLLKAGMLLALVHLQGNKSSVFRRSGFKEHLLKMLKIVELI